MEIRKYENTTCNVDEKLLRKDEYTFYVLDRILQGQCVLTITDHSRFIICHSCEPFPVWVWLPDDATAEEKNNVWNMMKSNGLLDGSYHFNTKYDFAEYMTARGKEEGIKFRITMNMLTYNCLETIEPKKNTTGYMRRAEKEDLNLAIDLIEDFHNAVDVDKLDRERNRWKAENLINEGKLFFWINEEKEVAAMCSYNCVGDKASIGNVYTVPEKRRMGYAARLVYNVTNIILEHGLKPLLYTDADYAASNGCYMGIGYRLAGNLCEVGIDK